MLQPYLDDPKFTPVEVARSSSAAEGLCRWVRAMAAYHVISKRVEPKKFALKEAAASLASEERVLAAKREQLQVREIDCL